MPDRPSIDDPAVLEAALERIRNRPRQYWLDLVERYDNEKPGDIVLPGVPPRKPATSHAEASATAVIPTKAKKRSHQRRAAA